MKLLATISYDGSKFFGFQRQTKKGKERHVTVESHFEETLRSVGIHSKILGSGRTDRGVHASGQVVSFDAPEYWKDLEWLKKELNSKMENKIVIRSLKVAPEEFHPRYSAKSRVYRYLIYTKNPNPFIADYVAFKDNLDLNRCNKALKLFTGKHDFEFYRKTGSDEKDTIRTITKAFAYRHKEHIVITIEGDGFLRSQIRMFVAAVFAYNDGKVTLEDLRRQMNKECRVVKKPAPHQGLYLARIKY